MYYLLILNVSDNAYTLIEGSQADVEAEMDIHESSINDFFVDGVADLQKENGDPCYVTEDKETMITKIRCEILAHESFFDDLEDPSAPTNDELYARIGTELGILQELQSRIPVTFLGG